MLATSNLGGLTGRAQRPLFYLGMIYANSGIIYYTHPIMKIEGRHRSNRKCNWHLSPPRI